MIDLIVAIIICIIVGLAIFYIIKEKKKGIKCIGCPFAQQCSHKENCNHQSLYDEYKNRS